MQHVKVEIVDNHDIPTVVLALQGNSAYSMAISLHAAKTRRGRKSIERWVDSIFLLEDGIEMRTAEALLDALDSVIGPAVDPPKNVKPWIRFLPRKRKEN